MRFTALELELNKHGYITIWVVPNRPQYMSIELLWLILGVRSINQSTQIYARAGSSTASRSWKSGFLSLVQRCHNIIHWTFQIRPETAAFEVKEFCIPTKKEYLLHRAKKKNSRKGQEFLERPRIRMAAPGSIFQF